MLAIQQRIKAFVTLGEFMREHLLFPLKRTETMKFNGLHLILNNGIAKSLKNNPWFIRRHVDYALFAIGEMLTAENLEAWVSRYNIPEPSDERMYDVGVIMAGNIPAVGFHDFLCVLMAGASFTGKLSANDPFLLPAISNVLISIEKNFSSKIKFSSEPIINADAIIATGSNNTARYFDYHYHHKPHIFRQNRYGVAVLTDKESEQQLEGLASDVFLHFGLGCRNVSKLYLPYGYNFTNLLRAFESAAYVAGHQPFMNNYRYNKATLAMQETKFIDNGFVLILNSDSIPAQAATLHYGYYPNIESLNKIIANDKNQIQCVVSAVKLPFTTTGFGTTQQPCLHDYADGIDTMDFILGLR